MRQLALLPLVALAFAACVDTSTPVGPEDSALDPFFAISDGAHAGNEHFYWLPPMLTPAPTVSGVFDGAADPAVTVCAWSGTACVGDPILTVDMAGGLTVNAVDEWYGTDWFLFVQEVANGDIFRVSVSASGQELGYADLMIVDKVTGQLKKTLGGEYLLLSENNGKKYLKIRFRVEEGAVVGDLCTEAPSGLVAWWPADGNAVDIVGGNDGLLVGGTAFGTGLVGQSFLFDGVDDHVFVTDAASLRLTGSLTIEAWVSISQLSSIVAIAGKWGESIRFDNYTIHAIQLGSQMELLGAIGDGSTGDSGVRGGVIPLNTWTHVAMTYDATTGTNNLYINGALTATRIRTGGTFEDNVEAFMIGATREDDPERFLAGSVDEVSVYDRALTQTEIQAISDAGDLGKCPA